MNESQKTFPEYNVPETRKISAYLQMGEVNSGTMGFEKPLVTMHTLITLIFGKRYLNNDQVLYIKYILLGLYQLYYNKALKETSYHWLI